MDMKELKGLLEHSTMKLTYDFYTYVILKQKKSHGKTAQLYDKIR